MSDKNFINFHIIISHSPSCLNRDDMGMQKTAVFGGVKRVRISSQSLKYAMRKSQYYFKHLGHPSKRTRLIINEHVNSLINENAVGSEEKKEVIDKTGLFLAAIIEGNKDVTKKKRSDSTGKIETQILPYTDIELSMLKDLLRKASEMGHSDKTERETKIKYMKEEIKKIDRSAHENMKLDIALSGRMATSQEMETIDAAMSVAHVITTHAVDGDIDWFTAVDDLTQEHGDTGSAHLDTQEFSSGVFYRFASINISQLQENLGEVDRNKTLDIAAHALHMLATVVPEAKQNSTGAYNMADFACVSFSDQPISLANAFEEPVETGKRGGFIQPSINKFAKYKDKVYEGYGLKDDVGFFSLREVSMEGSKKDSLADLEEWVRKDGKE